MEPQLCGWDVKRQLLWERHGGQTAVSLHVHIPGCERLCPFKQAQGCSSYQKVEAAPRPQRWRINKAGEKEDTPHGGREDTLPVKEARHRGHTLYGSVE